MTFHVAFWRSHHVASWLLVLCTVPSIVCGEPIVPVEALDPQSVADRMTDAHGGMVAWRALRTVQIAREHKSVLTPTDFRFNILADYTTHRIFESWERPAGTVVWDGERAWSVDWPLAQRLSPRFVTSIGFFLVNMPWLVQDQDTKLLGVTREAGLAADPGKTFVVLQVEFEADPVRKPRGVSGTRDTFRIYVDPNTWRLAGVHQSRTYAGQLDNFDRAPQDTAFVEIYVPTNYIEAHGLLWPERYDIYAPTGELTTRGRFFDYRFNLALDEALFRPPLGAPGLVFDTTSSYQPRYQQTQ